MSVEVFLDTNILIYAVCEDQEAPEKTAIARDILLNARWAWSVQVAQEFYVNVTRSKGGDVPISHVEALQWIAAWDYRPMQANTKGCFGKALEIKDRYQVSFWDANVIAAATLCRAPVLYSEDLNDGQCYGSVRLVNPFLASSGRDA